MPISRCKKLDLPHDLLQWLHHDSPAQKRRCGQLLMVVMLGIKDLFKLVDEEDLTNVRITFDGAYMIQASMSMASLVGSLIQMVITTPSYDITGISLHKTVAKMSSQSMPLINKPSSRWYSGSGIYRMLLFKSQIRFILRKFGTTILTPDLEKQWMARLILM